MVLVMHSNDSSSTDHDEVPDSSKSTSISACALTARNHWRQEIECGTFDSSFRPVPAKTSGRASYGIPDFIVTTATPDGKSGRVLLIVEDKLYGDPKMQLSTYLSLFSDNTPGLLGMGCRKSVQYPGVEFIFVEATPHTEDETADFDPIMGKYNILQDSEGRLWHPWNSPFVHKTLRLLAEKHRVPAKYIEDAIVNCCPDFVLPL